MSQLLVYGIRFKKATRVVDFDGTGVELSHGDLVIVEVEKGLGMGTVVNGPREPIRQGRKTKKIIRKADTTDVERFGFNSEREDEAFRACREKIAKYMLPMKLVSVEYLFDSSKVIFYFTSDTRVDFRGLVKDLASAFHTRIEMRQIGVRDEAKMIGGLGPCGRVLCCASFLSDFEPVTIKMAKDQNLALNPVKISGVCGRLMCCLSFEHEAYKKNKGKAAGSGGHGCHKGGHKSGQRDGGQKHCGGHAGGKPSGDKPSGGKQPDRQQTRGRQEGSKPEGEGSDRPSRNRSGRNRPNRNRPNRNRPNQAKDGGNTPAPRTEAQSQSTTARTEGGAESTDRQQNDRQTGRPESEGDRPNRNRQSRERSGRNRQGRNRSGRNRPNPNRSDSNRQAEGKASSGQGGQNSRNEQSGEGNKSGSGEQSRNSTLDTKPNPDTNKDS